MTSYVKQYFEVNKKYLFGAAFFAAAFTALGGGCLVAAVYMLSTEICGMVFLRENKKTSEPVMRKRFYGAYLKALVLQTGICAALFAAGSRVGASGGILRRFLPAAVYSGESVFSAAGYYFFIACLAVTALCVMVRIAAGFKTVGRAMLIIGTIYCAVFFEILYILFLSLAPLSGNVFFVHRIFAFCGAAAFLLMIIVFVLTARKYEGKFIKNDFGKNKK